MRFISGHFVTKAVVFVVASSLSLGPYALANEAAAPSYVSNHGGTFVAQKTIAEVKLEIEADALSLNRKKIVEAQAAQSLNRRQTILTKPSLEDSEKSPELVRSLTPRIHDDSSNENPEDETILTEAEKNRVKDSMKVLAETSSGARNDGTLTVFLNTGGSSILRKLQEYNKANFEESSESSEVEGQTVSQESYEGVIQGETGVPLEPGVVAGSTASMTTQTKDLLGEELSEKKNVAALDLKANLPSVENVTPVNSEARVSQSDRVGDASAPFKQFEALKGANAASANDLKKDYIKELLKKMGEKELIFIMDILSRAARSGVVEPAEKEVANAKELGFLTWMASLMQAAAESVHKYKDEGYSVNDWIRELRSRDQTFLRNNLVFVRGIKRILSESLSSDSAPSVVKQGGKAIGMQIELAERSSVLHAMHHMPDIHPFVSLLLDQKTDALRREYVKLIETVHDIYETASQASHLHIRYNGKQFSNYIPLIDEKGTYELIVG